LKKHLHLNLNRIDDVIVFNSLEKHDIDLIIEIELKKLYARVAELGYQLNLSKQKLIADKGFDKQFGARPLKRAIQKYVEDALAEEIITSKISIETKYLWILKMELKS
jgi:ATP-dependent Clp protease ATP-binding subunit ClpC